MRVLATAIVISLIGALPAAYLAPQTVKSNEIVTEAEEIETEEIAAETEESEEEEAVTKSLEETLFGVWDKVSATNNGEYLSFPGETYFTDGIVRNYDGEIVALYTVDGDAVTVTIPEADNLTVEAEITFDEIDLELGENYDSWVPAVSSGDPGNQMTITFRYVEDDTSDPLFPKKVDHEVVIVLKSDWYDTVDDLDDYYLPGYTFASESGAAFTFRYDEEQEKVVADMSNGGDVVEEGIEVYCNGSYGLIKFYFESGSRSYVFSELAYDHFTFHPEDSDASMTFVREEQAEESFPEEEPAEEESTEEAF